jgi:membrane associated rhomboid family serine protease
MFKFRSPTTEAWSSSYSLVAVLCIVQVSAFVLQAVALEILRVPWVQQLGLLSWPALLKGYVWTLLTYSFFHAGLFHLLINLLGLYFIGKSLEEQIGKKRLLCLFFTGIAVGGVLWSGIHYGSLDVLQGASAGVFALLVYFACSYPDTRVTLLLFFVLPVTLKPRWVAWALLGVEAFNFVFVEVLGAGSSAASSAHLGGMLGGYLCYILWHKAAVSWSRFYPTSWQVKPLPQRWAHRFEVNLQQRDVLRAQVDLILDKINNEGFGALTSQEREVLDKARDILKP